MSEMDPLVQQAIDVVGTSLVREAGKQVVRWLKRIFKSDGRMIKAVDAVAGEPDSATERNLLERRLQKELEESPSLTGELRRLLEQVSGGPTHAPQSADARGGSTIVQIQGNKNQT